MASTDINDKANITDLETHRVVKRTVTRRTETLADEVEAVMLALFEEPKFRAYRALDHDIAVEGSFVADDTLASLMIRNKAVEMGLRQVMAANLAQILRSLRVVERRYYC